MNQDLPPRSLSSVLRVLVVEDHEIFRSWAIAILREKYPTAEIRTAACAQDVLQTVDDWNPNLVILDLSIPEAPGETGQTESGIRLLKQLMERYPTLNLTIQSTYINALVRVRPDIDTHRGGFTIADKSLSTDDMLTRVDWALQGVTYTKDLKDKQSGLDVRPEWLDLLRFAFQEGLQDQAIAQHMNVSLRTVRNYWSKIQDVLGVYPEDGKNIRIQTEIRARDAGLID